MLNLWASCEKIVLAHLTVEVFAAPAMNLPKMKLPSSLLTLTPCLGLLLTATLPATVITFSGVAPTPTTYYEAGFQFNFIGGAIGDSVSVGDYYSIGNSVLHGHFDGGGYGSLTEIVVSRIDGGLFSLEQFDITSNTHTGGGAASGLEKTYISNNIGTSLLLPPDDWGAPFVTFAPGSAFENITSFSFYAESDIACFGIDNLVLVDSAIPEPSGIVALGALLGTGLILRRR